jgi:hypothetical protein
MTLPTETTVELLHFKKWIQRQNAVWNAEMLQYFSFPCS